MRSARGSQSSLGSSSSGSGSGSLRGSTTSESGGSGNGSGSGGGGMPPNAMVVAAAVAAAAAAAGAAAPGPLAEEEIQHNARATVELLRVAGTMLRTNIDGVRKLLLAVPESGGEEGGAEAMEGVEGAVAGGSEEVDRLGQALQDLLLSSSASSSSLAAAVQQQPPAAAAAAAAGSAQQQQQPQPSTMLATPPRVFPPTPAAGVRSAASGPPSSVGSLGGMSVGGGGGGYKGKGTGGGGGRLSGSSSASTASGRSSLHRHLYKQAEEEGGGEGEQEEEGEGEEGTDAATMDLSCSSGGSGSEAGAGSGMGVGGGGGSRRSSSLLLMMCRGAVEDPVAAVAHDGALLHEVFSYLVPPDPSARGLLGELALVCSIWKDVAASDAFWHPISCALFPALPSSIPGAGRLTDPTADDDDPSNSNSTDDKLDSSGMAVVAVAAGSAPVWQAGRTRCKGQVLAVGHALAHPGFRKSSSWQDGLSLMMEVVDQRDGKRLFYGAGRLHVACGQNTILRMTGTTRKEVAEPFSAADRDPGPERFETLKECMKGAHNPLYPISIRVRVFICDDRTGKVALLYQSGKSTKRHAKTPNASYWQDFLPESDALYIWDSDMVVYGKEGHNAKLAAAMYIVPVDEDDNTPEKHRMYRIAGGDVERYGTHSSYVSLDFSTSDGEAVAKFVRGLLQA